ncbi:hypothetical protein TWF481_004115 [Arthrobotrys musiformis]|uniref:Uncharacterized protein n=1 Tax=Arthrobotrys musiformis TaxID=47236 RepID=A0AAV9WKH3_9PEZI
MLFSKIAVTVAFFAGASVALESNGSPFIAYVCPPGPADNPFVYRNAASTRGVQTKCGYVAQDNTNPPRHGVLVNQCPESLPDTPECTWYAFDQTFDIPANGAPFVLYATKHEADFDATAVRCKQAGCKWISRANKVKKAGTMAVLCNMCERSPEDTPGADAYGFGNNPPQVKAPPPAPKVDDPPAPKVETVTSTVTVGGDTKTVRVIEYINKRPSRTITSWIVKPTPDGAPTTVTKTIRKGGQTETVYVVYMAGRPIRTSTAVAADVETKTVTRYISKGGHRNTIIVKYYGGTTKTITVGPAPTDDGDDGYGGAPDGNDGAGY